MSSFDFGSGFCYCLSGDGIKDNGLRGFGLLSLPFLEPERANCSFLKVLKTSSVSSRGPAEPSSLAEQAHGLDR
jgi:hypothetical protein